MAKKGCDLKLLASNGSVHWAHSSVLCSQSVVFERMLQGAEFREQKEQVVKTNVKRQTLQNLLDATYCQEVVDFGFHQACDLLQVALFYALDHVIKITVKFLVRCARHRCPEACCMFEQPENIRTALARFQEGE